MKPISKSVKLQLIIGRVIVKQYAAGEPFSHKEVDQFIAGLTLEDMELDAWSKETTPSGFTRREHARGWVLPGSMVYAGHVEKVKRGVFTVLASTITHFANISDKDLLQEWGDAWDKRAAIKGSKLITQSTDLTLLDSEADVLLEIRLATDTLAHITQVMRQTKSPSMCVLYNDWKKTLASVIAAGLHKV